MHNTMTRRALLGAAALAASRTAHAQQILGGPSISIVLSWDFTRGSQLWLAGFSDYTLGMKGLDRIAELRPLPQETGVSGGGYYLHGHNRSDDLFMFLKRQIGTEDGLHPNQWYRASMHIQIASNAPSNCAGAGGAPGEDVYLKAGVTREEPTTLLYGDQVHFNLDKGQQSMGGAHLQLAGNIANGIPCGLPVGPRYAMLERVVFLDDPVQTDPHGSLWLTVGTDSAFEGPTGLYYYTIGVVLQPVAVAA